MKQILTPLEKRCINKLIELKLFDSIMTEKLNISNGIIIVPCSDGHQFGDVYGHIATVCKQVVDVDLIHPVALNGGAMLMSNLLPEKQCRHGNTMLENILEASQPNVKNTKDVFLYAHFPCAIARGNGIGVVDQGLYLMKAKKRLQEADPGMRIKCFFHIDTFDEVESGTHKKRTYFMPKDLWNDEELIHSVLHDYMSMLSQ